MYAFTHDLLPQMAVTHTHARVLDFQNNAAIIYSLKYIYTYTYT